MPFSIIGVLKKGFNINSDIDNECMRVNLKRLFPFCAAAMAVYALVLMLTFFIGIQDPVRLVSVLHFYLVILACAAASLTASLWSKRHPTAIAFGYFVQFLSLLMIAAFGLYSILRSYLVFSSPIAPYIISSLILSMVFLLRPGLSLLLFTSMYVSFVFVMQAYTEAVRLSNLINGFTITAVCFFLSVTMWKYNRTNLLQKRQISEHQESLEQANKHLAQMAYYDTLTGLPNRRFFCDIIKKETALMLRKRHESFLVMLDIDHFKCVNDQYGHTIGDRLLIEAGSVLSANIRKCDTLCRLGGEEFILLLPQTAKDRAMAIAEKLRKRLALHTFTFGNITLSVTVSIGVARLVDDPSATVTKQYANVDRALYKAKQAGRNCIRAL